jgi:2-polyprenyl-6-methoxyphenol hydroxylase-like FAD-dependent oxidoreductase
MPKSYPRDFHTIIIGAGPVGLCSAIFFALQYPNSTITILEKRNKYKRKQILLLQKDILKFFPKPILQQLRQHGCHIKPPASTSYQAECGLKASQNTIGISIHTYKLENILLNHITSHLHNIFYINNLTDKYQTLDLPTPNFVFICDGANSQYATDILHAKKHDLRTYYGIITILNVPSTTTPTPTYIKNSPSQYRFRAFSSKDDNFYLGISISQEMYQALTQHLPWAQNKLKDIIIQASHHYGWQHGQYDAQPFQINTFYRKPVSKKIQDTKYFAIGDAAFSGHFFSGQAVNSGIREAHYLCRNILSPAIITQYRKFVNGQYQKFHKTIQKFIIPFERIDNLDQHLTDQDVQDIAQRHRINIKGFSKQQALLFMSRVIL